MKAKSIAIDKRRNVKYIQPISALENIKSFYILKVIFNCLMKSKQFKIIKYNKKIQNRLNITIDNYKKYREKFSQIEIEIIPIKNKNTQFINITEYEKPYYHIYFNDNKEEIKKYSLDKKDKVSKINIIIDYQIESFDGLFYECKYIKSISFKKFYRNNINNMNSMFQWCVSLEKLNLSNFNTDNVTDMNGMFYECHSLIELDLSKFNIGKVKDMRYMFFGCHSLENLILFNYATIAHPRMEDMFNGCTTSFKEKLKRKNRIFYHLYLYFINNKYY